ncbi:MAG TPA: aryl-sulfate sulfotransferase [Longimicrobiales bacterium]|nr:aryl-sulfate sulfotransferase [Longimicrobiales bacterium]
MRLLVVAIVAAVLTPATLFGYQSVFPTGTTIFHPDKTWSGYTILDTPGEAGAVLIDMNGNLLKRWPAVAAVPGPFRVLPGGYVVGGTNRRRPHQEAPELIQVDWDGEVVWRFDRTELVEHEGAAPRWMARQHHDWQREGSPVGYFAPGAEPLVDEGRTLILAHRNVLAPDISDKLLEDDYILEVSWDGTVLWDWLASDHIEELGFSGEARNALYRYPNWNEERGSGDWLHINAASYVGPNRWYDDGDERFHPDNVLWGSREANIIAIISRETGEIVWKMGPDYRDVPALAELGQIVGQHHPHIIPQGLPGAGNLLVFDNGGVAGYGAPNPTAPTGRGSSRRIFSRVLELNPVTFEEIWEYSVPGQEQITFFSQYVSSAQRLPNGNTLITEGAIGRIFEVTADKEIVWEYVSPYYASDPTRTNRIFRAHRLPYEWVPQLSRPLETAVIPPPNEEFRIGSR